MIHESDAYVVIIPASDTYLLVIHKSDTYIYIFIQINRAKYGWDRLFKGAGVTANRYSPKYVPQIIINRKIVTPPVLIYR